MKNNAKSFCIPILDNDMAEYRKELANLNLRKRDIRRSYISKVEGDFSKEFGSCRLDDIFDSLTGGVTFSDEEWELIDERDPIKRLFEKKDNDGTLCYMLHMDGKVLLRGSDIYYFFSCYLSRFKYPTLKQIEIWFENCILFLRESGNAIRDYKSDTEVAFRLFLGILDNIRNMVLISATSGLICSLEEHKILFSEEDAAWSKHIYSYLELMDKICFGSCNFYEITSEIYELIKSVLDDLPAVRKDIAQMNDGYLLLKCVNPWREADNYIENYIGMMYVADQLGHSCKSLHLIGLLCGGLELPFVLKKRLKEKMDVTLSFVFQKTGLYIEKIKKFCNNGEELGIPYEQNEEAINMLIDENAQSGISAQLAVQKLNSVGIQIHKLALLRNPSLARTEQLRKSSRALNLEIFDYMILGGLYPSPYTHLKKDTNYGDMYLDEMSLFSYGAEAFLKALFKNNTFIKDSEVDIFKGYSKGKDGKIYEGSD